MVVSVATRERADRRREGEGPWTGTAPAARRRDGEGPSAGVALAAWFENPVGFVEGELGCPLWRKQADILKAVRDHRRVAVRSCNGSGKTYTAACAVVWWLSSFTEAIAVTTAPTERQVKELLWREIRRIHTRNAAFIGGDCHQTALDISPSRFARGFTSDSPERFQGFHHANILFVVDEASGVPEEIYEAIEGSMTTGRARLLLIGNPTRREGTFYDAFHSRRGLWRTIHISAFDTPNLRLPSLPLPLRERVGVRGQQSPLTAEVDGGEGPQALSLATARPEPVEGPRTPPLSVAAERGPSTTLGTSDDEVAGEPQDADSAVPGLITQQWVAEAAANWGKDHPRYQVRVLGEFPSQSEDTLIPLTRIEEAIDPALSATGRARQQDGSDSPPGAVERVSQATEPRPEALEGRRPEALEGHEALEGAAV